MAKSDFNGKASLSDWWSGSENATIGILYRNQSNKEPQCTTGQLQIGRACLCLQPSQLRLHPSVQNKGWKNKWHPSQKPGQTFLSPDFLTLWTLIDTSTSAPYSICSAQRHDLMASIWATILLYHNGSCNQPGWHPAMKARRRRSWQALAWRRRSKHTGKTVFIPATDTYKYTHTLLSFFRPSVLGSASRTGIVPLTPLWLWGKTGLSFLIPTQIHLLAPSHQQEKPRRRVDDGQLGRHLE